MNYLSVCSGIEAATVAWHPLGWSPVGFAEIDKFPSAVLKHHFPKVPNYGDFTKIDGLSIDLLVGGTPCQDFSVAGLRAGLDGDRGQLTIEFAKLVGRLRPRWVVWENVPGVLSSDGGRAFGIFLGELGKLGYGFAYRILDAQYFGVPQRRRRVFVVGYLGDWRRAAAVLFERHSLSRYPTPSRKEREDTSRNATQRLGNGGEIFPTLCANYGDKWGLGDQEAFKGEHHILERQKPIYASDGQSNAAFSEDQALSLNSTHENPYILHVANPTTAPCLTKNYGRQPDNSDTNSGPMLIAVDQEFNTMREGVIGGLKVGGRGGFCPPTIAIPFRIHGENSTAMTNNGSARVADEAQIARSLDSCGGYATNQGGNIVLYTSLFDPHHDEHDGRGANFRTTDTSPSFRGPNGTDNTLIAFSAKDHGADAGEVAPTLRASGFDKSHANSGNWAAVAIGLDGEQNAVKDGYGTLTSRREGGGFEGSVMTQRMEVRRLTPEECELLQGFERGYTKISDKTSDGPRYKALGNSMAVPVVRWIGERIQMVEEMTQKSH